MYPYNKKLTNNAKNLRKNMTPEEKHLWYDFLKHLPITVKRQYVVESFILDFFIPSANVAIELDGSQHFESELKEADKERDARLCILGIKVLRYTNLDIQRRFDAVSKDILRNIGLDLMA
jgi:very-short-patch-repair endonuclease